MFEESVFTGGIVVMKVGREKREVHVHRDLIRSRSPYFRRVLARQCANTTTLAIFDVDVDTFCQFLSWVYADCFMTSKKDEWMSLSKLWLLAERFQVPALQNRVVEAFSCLLYQREMARLDLEILHFVYDNTGPASMLRSLFVHISMWYGHQDVFAQVRTDLPPIFHKDYAAQQAEKAQKLASDAVLDPWDLTNYLLPEYSIAEAKRSVNAKVENGGETMGITNHDPEGDSSKRRKRQRNEQS